eukprot:gb/GECH01002963.1/.p1 GENE.gb/GECH01002963.1/~~gb/GECH01002963.1/.p1  ORF type:complete len:298 (+),score=38.86 gb/GECH01002963.1/:1-894(+)
MSSNDSPERENDRKHERESSPRPESRERSPALSDRELSPHSNNHRDYPPVESLEDREPRHRRRDRSYSPHGGRHHRSPSPRGPSKRNTGHTLFISPLDPDCKEEDIERKFSEVGNVSKVSIIYDPHSRQNRGFGFVDMETRDEAYDAIEKLNNSELLGTSLKVQKAKRSEPRRPTPGRYMGSRPRSRRRHGPPPPPPPGYAPPHQPYYYYPMPPARPYRFDPYEPHQHHLRMPPHYRGSRRRRASPPDYPFSTFSPHSPDYHQHHHHHHRRRRMSSRTPSPSPSPPYSRRRYSRSRS